MFGRPPCCRLSECSNWYFLLGIRTEWRFNFCYEEKVSTAFEIFAEGNGLPLFRKVVCAA